MKGSLVFSDYRKVIVFAPTTQASTAGPSVSFEARYWWMQELRVVLSQHYTLVWGDVTNGNASGCEPHEITPHHNYHVRLIGTHLQKILPPRVRVHPDAFSVASAVRIAVADFDKVCDQLFGHLSLDEFKREWDNATD
jgi:hypothetical protein